MIKSIQFRNFKALRDSTLPLSQFTLIIGPNGTGKSTALQGIQFVGNPGSFTCEKIVSAASEPPPTVSVAVAWESPEGFSTVRWQRQEGGTQRGDSGASASLRWGQLAKFRTFSLNAQSIAQYVELQRDMELGPDGRALPGVLDRLRDQHPERFEALNVELGRWIPEFDRVLFETPLPGHRSFSLRTREGFKIPAADLSQGTLLALAILTLAYIPDPPPIVGLEEPDRGIHPRLLREVKDAMYRLAYPESVGEKRPAVQVIATTHSPYMVDLFRDHPEEIVIADKVGDNVRFQRLSDMPNVREILQDAHLGDLWYSGILGGVPGDK